MVDCRCLGRLSGQPLRITIRRFLYLLFCLSVCSMTGIGLLMAYGLIPGSHGGRGLEITGWDYHDWDDSQALAINLFFTLATANLLVVWAWLIRCAAKGDFLRLAAGLLAGAAIIGAMLFLTPSECSRSQ